MLYRHYKGNEYEVLIDATHVVTGEKFVVYWSKDVIDKLTVYPFLAFNTETGKSYVVRINGTARDYNPYMDGMQERQNFKTIWARPYDMFHGHLEDGTKRFVEITS